MSGTGKNNVSIVKQDFDGDKRLGAGFKNIVYH